MGEPWDAEQLWEVLVSQSPTGKPGKAAPGEHQRRQQMVNLVWDKYCRRAWAGSAQAGAGLREAEHLWFGNGHGTEMQRLRTPG